MRILPRKESGPTDNIIQTIFVYRPGDALPIYQVYNDWLKLVADLELVVGPKIVEIDDSIISPAPIPEGTYDLKDVTLVGSSRQRDVPPVMSIVDNTVFANLEKISFLEIEADLIIPAFVSMGSSQIILQDVILSVVGAGGEVFGSNASLDIVLDRTVIQGSYPVISVVDGTTNIWLLNQSRILQDTISAEADTTVNFYVVDPNVYFESQAGILGTFNIVKKSEAEQVNIVDVGGNYVSTDVESALQEIGDSRGQPNGLATLDYLGLIPLSQLPTPHPLNFRGFWDANANSPNINSGAVQGDAWIVNVAGTTLLSGINDWQVADWAIYNGTDWYKLDNSNYVLSVNGYTGVVVLNKTDVGLGNVEDIALSTWSGSTNINTLGTVTTGTWNATTIDVAYGGTGLSTAGGTANRVLYTSDGTTFTTGLVPNAALSNSSLTVTAGTGLSGGGLVSLGGSTTLNIANTAVAAGSYGTASSVPTFTVNAQGQLTAASNTAIAISASQITGGTLPNTVSVQNVYQTVTAAISGGSAALTFGQVVYLKNSGGSASSPAVDLALGSSSNSLNTIGLVASTTIPNNNTGSVVTYGVIVGTPAVPLNTNAYTQGDTLYVDTTTAGALTNVAPSYPNLAIPVGIVIVRNATQGAIYVNSNIGLNAAPQIKMPAPSVKTTLSAPATTSILKSVFAPPTVSAIEYLVLDFTGAGNVVLSAGPIEALTAADYGRKLTIHNISTKTITFNSGGTAYLSGGVNLVLPANGIVSFVWSFVGGGVGRWVQLAPAITVS